ncbi:TadE/TadG family type IV pilus assembly protein [Novosphingobium sp. 9U]|uniref:TadE/TadG family type IV pilus assembly protein n=1 Tax=Novosphingobium sp. 9U TaxID=2653158 RepID=UPI0012F28BB0|nr:TadE/TadG family type IV pilus assembly protein [Novosphingobium sp. 9U]VWX54345.1 conserved hypothetical protein [Novosphingobium sp. 9U]
MSCSRSTLLHRLRADRRGVSAVEFALVLPLFIGLMGAGLEMANLMVTQMKVQRLATMTADLVSQRGSSSDQISEVQIYDILSALDVSASPLNVRSRGRVIISAVVGEDTDNNGTADVNRIKWQRFDGGFTGATIQLGCWSTSTSTTLKNARQLTVGEALFHAQVSYQYVPLFSQALVQWFAVPTEITRTAAFRGRGSIYRPVLTVENYPAKQNCTSATGL